MSLTSRLSLQQYLLWNTNREFNPKTGRKIKINGPIYLEIESGWNKLQENSNFSIQECKEWLSNKLVNPKTGKRITEGGFVYETIRNKCELLDIDKSNKLYNSIVESDSSYSDSSDNDDAPSISDNELEPIEESKISSPKKLPLSITCRDQKCMMKGCAWNGSYGINFSSFPKLFIKSISLFFPHLNPRRCCCFCFGHMILFLSFIGTKSASSCIPKNVKELSKIQLTIDKLESVEGTLNDKTKKIFITEANIEMTKGISSVFKKGLPVLKSMMKVIKENSSGMFSSISEGLSNAVNIFTCSE